MRLARTVPWVLIAAGLLSGCGGSTDYASSTRATVTKIGSVLSTYNAAPQRTLSQTGQACTEAASKLQALKGIDPKSAPSQYRREAQAIQQGYATAIHGFTDCERGALYQSYPLMVLSDSELSQANSWLQRATKLDRT